MSHTLHIAKNKKILEIRFEIIKAIREFFWSKQFIEIEAPMIIAHPGMEPNISVMNVTIHNEQGEKFNGFLHTSPEYSMKKMLAAGFTNIFYLGKTFRNYESFGGLHNPEFTMLEFYRVGVDMFALMDDVQNMIDYIVEQGIGNRERIVFRRLAMKEVWKKFVSVDLDDCLTQKKMYELCKEKKYNVKKTESYEELFYRIFLHEIEPKLKELGAVIIHHYPAQMAALSKISDNDPRYAERFEVYIDGIEIGNAFSELTDADEQLRRLESEQDERKRQGKEVYAIDSEFIESLHMMPTSSGIAMGVDRLVQVLVDCEDIDDVIPLSMKQLFLL